MSNLFNTRTQELLRVMKVVIDWSGMTVRSFFGVDSRILDPLIPDIFNICSFMRLFNEKQGGDKKTDEKENGVISEDE